AHFSEGAARLAELEGTAIELDADEAHGITVRGGGSAVVLALASICMSGLVHASALAGWIVNCVNRIPTVSKARPGRTGEHGLKFTDDRECDLGGRLAAEVETDRGVNPNIALVATQALEHPLGSLARAEHANVADARVEQGGKTLSIRIEGMVHDNR